MIYDDDTALHAQYVTSLTLQNFRNYSWFQCHMPPTPIVLVGSNGVGKTNILEALSLLQAGRGLRGAALVDMSRVGANQPWVLGANVERGEGQYVQLGSKLQQQSGRTSRQFLDGGEVISNAQAHEICPMMLWFTPMMDGLFMGPAADRRRFFDRALSSLDGQYKPQLNRYDGLVRERNRLLSDGADDIWLNAVESQMAELAVPIAAARVQLLADIAHGCTLLPDTFPQPLMGWQGDVEAMMTENTAALDVEDALRERWQNDRAKDQIVGRTAFGPHRSDMLFWYEAKELPASQSSTGEQKALMLSLLMALARVSGWRRGRLPILLLDEVVAHLDPTRREHLCDALSALNMQVWMTGTEAEHFAAWRERASFFAVTRDESCGAIATEFRSENV